MASGRNNNGAVTVVWLMVAAVVLAALYFWLIGQWFARVVMFPCFAALTCAAGAALVHQMQGDGAMWFLAVCVGVVAAWYISGIPVYYWRANERALVRMSRGIGNASGAGGVVNITSREASGWR